MRKVLSIVLGIALLSGAIFISKKFVDSKNKPAAEFSKIVRAVSVDTVRNGEVPIIISSSGSLSAKHKIELFAEVQGVLKPAAKEFKEGTNYKKGELLLNINSDEFYANLQSQKSIFHNSIVAIIPDIRLDYPNEFLKWQGYLNSFDMKKTIPKLPVLSTERETYFISKSGVTTAYYAVKNLEVKLGKYNIRAPYKGILTEALVTAGTLIRVGQKLGEFIDPMVYEMEVSVNAEFADLLRKGNSVTLRNLGKTREYAGTVIRVNGKIDAASQTIKTYIQATHDDLKEGMYLEASLVARSEKEAVEIPVELLIDNKQLYAVRDSVLELIDVIPIYYSTDKVVVKGIEDGTLLLAKPMSGAYNGMQVEISQN